MPNNTSSQTAPAPNGQGGLLKNLILLALPVLTLQSELLVKLRQALQQHKGDHVQAVGKFVAFELHALMMLLDPERKLRDRIDKDMEKELADKVTQIIDKTADSAITVEFQNWIQKSRRK